MSTTALRPRVAILAPMPSELRPLVAALGLARARGDRSGWLRGATGRVDVVAALTGVGPRAGAAAAARMLDAEAPDHLLVVGIAGGLGAGVAVGDLVVPERVLDLETGATFRPAPLGARTPHGTLASSDVLVTSPVEAARLTKRGVVAIDMETAAIGAVCARRGCPWSVFRAISDRADDGTTDQAILGLIDADGRPRPLAVARFLVTRPHRVPQLARLARGARAATRAATEGAVAALDQL